jgi:low temperature requirement protein LtrA
MAHPHDALHGVGLAMMLGGPALFLAGETLFGRRMTGTTDVPRVLVAGCLVLLVPIGGEVSALLLAVAVGALLTALVLWELRAPASQRQTRRSPAIAASSPNSSFRRSPRRL